MTRSGLAFAAPLQLAPPAEPAQVAALPSPCGARLALRGAVAAQAKARP
jgi:hypothetical protein